jgi:hypothetical protein
MAPKETRSCLGKQAVEGHHSTCLRGQPSHTAFPFTLASGVHVAHGETTQGPDFKSVNQPLT